MARNTKHSVTAIAQFMNVGHSFVSSWAGKTTAVTKTGRGRKHIIPDSALLALRAKVEKKRFGSGNKVRAEYVNPKTGKPISEATIVRALERSG